MIEIRVQTQEELKKKDPQYASLLVGDFSPDENGYWLINAGAFNVAVEMAPGHWVSFPYTSEIFGKNTQLMDYLDKGVLSSELDHPQVPPGTPDQVVAARLSTILIDRKSAHIKDILAVDIGKKDTRCVESTGNIILIVLRLKPEGNFGSQFLETLKNPYSNTSMSIRGFAKKTMVGGNEVRRFTRVITWDQVLRGAYDGANKRDSMDYAALSMTNSICIDGVCSGGLTATMLSQVANLPDILMAELSARRSLEQLYVR